MPARSARDRQCHPPMFRARHARDVRPALRHAPVRQREWLCVLWLTGVPRGCCCVRPCRPFVRLSSHGVKQGWCCVRLNSSCVPPRWLCVRPSVVVLRFLPTRPPPLLRFFPTRPLPLRSRLVCWPSPPWPPHCCAHRVHVVTTDATCAELCLVTAVMTIVMTRLTCLMQLPLPTRLTR